MRAVLRSPSVLVFQLAEKLAVMLCRTTDSTNGNYKVYDEIAVFSGGVVYFQATRTPAEQRAVNDWHQHAPHCLVNPAEFRFLLGSALTTTGLPLTRLREEEAVDDKA